MDNRKAVISYGYDALNRMTSKMYTVPAGVAATPSVSYCYDGLQPAGTTCPSLAKSANPTGRLTCVISTNSQTYYSAFDGVGRVLSHSQVTAGQMYSLSYAYNLAGSLRCETYPTGRTVVTAYDGANRTAQVASGACPAAGTNPPLGMPAYVTGSQAASGSGSAIQYAAHGAPSFYFYGNNLARQVSYNSRLQMNGFIDSVNNSSGSELLKATLNWYAGTDGTKNNGNLMGATYVNGGPGYPSFLAFSQTYTYDAVNRLTGVTDTGYTRSFQYDAFGNMYISGFTVITPQGAPQAAGSYNGYNQLNLGTYDAAGNQTTVNANTITYDVENRQAMVAGLGVNETYVYDGDGRRVAKGVTGSAPNTVFVYDATGQLVAEYTAAASGSPCTTCYLSADHLGTTRLVTNGDGVATVIARHDYLPFGEEIGAGQAGRDSHWGVGNDAVSEKVYRQRTGFGIGAGLLWGKVLRICSR